MEIGIHAAGDTSCSIGEVSETIAQGCTADVLAEADAYIDVGPFQFNVSDCGDASSNSDFDIPQSEPVRICAPPPSIDECPMGNCFPEALTEFGRVCIVRPGTEPCPEGLPYSDRYVVGTSVVDDRSCPECTCGSPPLLGCNAVVNVYDGDNCEDTEPVPTSSGCQPLSQASNNFSAEVLDVRVSGTCDPTDPSPDPIGSVGFRDPITLCYML